MVLSWKKGDNFFLGFFHFWGLSIHFLAMKYMKHLIEADDATEIRVQNDFFMTSGSLDTVQHFLNGHVTL